jgi:hypothetical protein
MVTSEHLHLHCWLGWLAPAQSRPKLNCRLRPIIKCVTCKYGMSCVVTGMQITQTGSG